MVRRSRLYGPVRMHSLLGDGLHAPGLRPGIRGKQILLQLSFGSENAQAETILCRIARAHGISNGRETTAVLTTQTLLNRENTSPQNSSPDKNQFNARLRTTPNQPIVIQPTTPT